MTDFIKKYLLPFSLIIIALIISNFIYTKLFFENNIQINSSVINTVRDIPDSAQVLYIGESSNNRTHFLDKDKRKISGFIDDYFPKLKIASITQPAYHAGAYYVLLQNIPDKSKIKTIIVTLNFRTFDANWRYSNLETAIQKELVLIKPEYPPLFRRFLLSFKGYDHKSDREREAQFKHDWEVNILKFPYNFPYKNVVQWDSGMALKGFKVDDSIRNDPLTALACHYIKTYAFQIDTNSNPRIKDFDKIIRLAHKRHWNVIFNLIGENVQQANELVGKDLIFLINQNKELLLNRFRKMGALVVDNLDSIPEDQFIDRNWTTEHYREFGRKIIAYNVAQTLKHFYLSYYKNIGRPIYHSQLEFSNDCESDTTWGQKQTICNEKSKSGNKSSKFFGNNPYSLTFSYPSYLIPFEKRDSIEVIANLLVPDRKAPVTLYCTLDGENIYWGKTINMNNELITFNKWCEIDYKIKLPKDIMSLTATFKVFWYNPSDIPCYVDDIHVKFY